MKEIFFIDGKTKIRLKNNHLVEYLNRIEAAGYVVKANKCKINEGFRDILMVGKSKDFEEFFSGFATIKKIHKHFPQIYHLLFNDREIVLYLLQEDYEII